jgi:2-keto-3-deoxy-L-rhamnonate aldolase RhmA
VGAEERVLSACKEAGVPIGILASSVEAALRQRSRGYDLIALGTEVGVLQSALSGMIRQLR